MSAKTSIEWTDRTWNPLIASLAVEIRVKLKKGGERVFPVGTRGWYCTKCSEGCANCYAEKINFRLGNGLTYIVGNLASIRFELHDLTAPMRWKKPGRVFVNSMTDLFHDAVPNTIIDDVFGVMAAVRLQQFQVLTKRAKRMRDYFAAADVWRRIDEAAWRITGLGSRVTGPLPNVWLGVSVENQKRADERIPHLLETPAAVRFLSCEPLLGAVNLEAMPVNPDDSLFRYWPLTGAHLRDGMNEPRILPGAQRLHWVIAGGKSGPKARPMHPDWARSLRDQCAAAHVPFLFKQWGDWMPGISFNDADLSDFDEGQFSLTCALEPNGRVVPERYGCYEYQPAPRSHLMARVGKKKAGRLLDGREHDEFPKTERRPA